MAEKEFEPISAFVDGELSDRELDRILSDMANNGEMCTRWKRYHLIGDAMRRNLPETFKHDLASRISKALESELPIVAPLPKKESKSDQPSRRSLTGYAVAASVAAVGFIAVGVLTQPLNVNVPITGAQMSAAPVAPVAQTVAMQKNDAPAATRPLVVIDNGASDASDDIFADASAADNGVAPRLRALVISHESSTTTSVRRGLPPYVRLATFSTGNNNGQ